MKLTAESRSTRGKTCPSETLSTTNPTCTDPASNPGFRGERPATNRLSHGTARIPHLHFISATKWPSLLHNLNWSSKRLLHAVCENLHLHSSFSWQLILDHVAKIDRPFIEHELSLPPLYDPTISHYDLQTLIFRILKTHLNVVFWYKPAS
jgi:hypothetical protein